MEQITLEEAITRKAIAEVEAHANEKWKSAAMGVVISLARKGGRFTTDEVWHELDQTDYRTHEPRAMGAVMLQAVRNGYIENTQTFQKSTRAACHRRPIAVYMSRLPW